jgi:putative CocE/NonD family hydrolase
MNVVQSIVRQRRSLLIAVLLVLAAAVLLLATWRSLDLPARIAVKASVLGIQVDDGVRVVAQDGVALASTLYLPRTDSGRLATIYIRLPYDRKAYGEALGAALFFARQGYAVLLQDVRGTHGSGGRFVPWQHATGDGATTLDWIARQAWSNGKVGTYGCSALGELQYSLARANHSAHAAMMPSGAGGALGVTARFPSAFGWFEGGVLQWAGAVGWFLRHGAIDPGAPAAPAVDLARLRARLPVADAVRSVSPGANAIDEYLGLPLGSPAWSNYDFVTEADQWSVPTIDINTWGDPTVGATLALAELARRTAAVDKPIRHHVVIGPGAHCEHDAVASAGRFGVLTVHDADRPYREWALRWFDHHLRGAPDALSGLPAYQVFVVGENRWIAADTWPPAAARPQRLYLASQGRANTASGDGVLLMAPPQLPGADAYDYDPARPAPSIGGPVCCTGVTVDASGPQDQAAVEARADVLVYTSAPLEQPLRIAGPLRARVFLQSDAPDTDLVLRLTDVAPDGRSINIQEGALRARYRRSVLAPQPLVPGEIAALDVDLRAIAWRLPAGHRLRLQVTSSAFPRLERNLNTGGDNARERVGRIAHNRVLHGPQHASYVEFYRLDD